MGNIESNRAFGGVGGKQQRPHPETYSSSRISPPIVFKAPWRVVGLEIIGDRELYVWFVDGTAGRVKFMPSFFEKEVFAHLADSAFFEEVDVRYGTVIWPGNIDLAPDAMHEAIQRHGEWVLQ